MKNLFPMHAAPTKSGSFYFLGSLLLTAVINGFVAGITLAIVALFVKAAI